MAEKIKVLIADDIEETRKNIKDLLGFEKRIEIVGEAENGKEAIKLARELKPDLILMDINMPEIDGLKAAEKINIEFPEIIIIIISVQGEQEYLKKAMYCGVKGYLIKPFTIETLIDTITKTYDKEQQKKQYLSQNQTKKIKNQEGKIVTFFSTKGGVGKTTLAVNTAINIAKVTGEKVALLDLDIQFGDIAVTLNINPTKTIMDVIEEANHLNKEILDEYMIKYIGEIKILAAPTTPEYVEYISSSHVEKIIEILKKEYQYIIIDTSSDFSENVLTALDNSDIIIFISTMNLPTIKNVKLGLDIMKSLKYPEEKVKIIVNKISKHYDIKIKDIEEVLEKKVSISIPEDNKTVIPASNKGYPFIRLKKDSKISQSIKKLSELIIFRDENKPKESFINKLFSKSEFLFNGRI